MSEEDQELFEILSLFKEVYEAQIEMCEQALQSGPNQRDYACFLAVSKVLASSITVRDELRVRVAEMEKERVA